MTFRAALVALVVSACGCAIGSRAQRSDRPPAFSAILLNGGGTVTTNYRSHAVHLHTMHKALRETGVPPTAIATLASDGDDSAPDIAVTVTARGDQPWLLEGTTMEGLLQPVRYGSTYLPGISLLPATRDSVEEWFDGPGSELPPGETLMMFVTDHGQRGKTSRDNSIVLWNRDEMNVRQLAAQIGKTDPRVRVVAVMSQCFSGGFADLALDDRPSDRAAGSVCGFFSTTAARMAYGCHTESRSDQGEGHAMHFAAALRRTGSFVEAHRATMIEDRSPDVPLRTSDVFLERVVAAAAGAEGTVPDEFVARQATDALAFSHPDAELLRAAAAAFSLEIPRSDAELRDQHAVLDGFAIQAAHQAAVWRDAVGDLAQLNLDEFLANHGSWRQKLSPSTIRYLPERTLALAQRALLSTLAAFTADHPERGEPMQHGRQRAQVMKAVAWRANVRQAALLRIQTLLVSLVGRAWLAQKGTQPDRDVLAALDDCESTRLPGKPSGLTAAPQPAPLPSLEMDRTLIAQHSPTKLDVRFDRTDATAPPGLPAGAVRIASVVMGSAAAAAGLRVGDVLSAIDGSALNVPGATRLRLALTNPDRPLSLNVLREGTPLEIVVPASSRGGEVGPRPLGAARRRAIEGLAEYRGSARASVRDGRSYVLFFWATWCQVCKTALPELLALEKREGVRIVAVTSEDRDTVREFLRRWPLAFPEVVALDPGGYLQETFHVDAYPTFVRVDEQTRVTGYGRGFDRDHGVVLEPMAEP